MFSEPRKIYPKLFPWQTITLRQPAWEFPQVARPIGDRQPMKFDSAKAVFCGVALLRTALPADGSETYHITMELPAPYYSPFCSKGDGQVVQIQ